MVDWVKFLFGDDTKRKKYDPLKGVAKKAAPTKEEVKREELPSKLPDNCGYQAAHPKQLEIPDNIVTGKQIGRASCRERVYGLV